MQKYASTTYSRWASASMLADVAQKAKSLRAARANFLPCKIPASFSGAVERCSQESPRLASRTCLECAEAALGSHIVPPLSGHQSQHKPGQALHQLLPDCTLLLLGRPSLQAAQRQLLPDGFQRTQALVQVSCENQGVC